ncbi:MAG: hypothetical protein ACR2IJ_07250 [Fluviibacter sp.]
MTEVVEIADEESVPTVSVPLTLPFPLRVSAEVDKEPAETAPLTVSAAATTDPTVVNAAAVTPPLKAALVL